MALPVLVMGEKYKSSWSLRPWLALKHFDVAFDEVLLPLFTPQYHEQIGRWSPTGQVPVLHHDGVVVWDSLAILEYANETFFGQRGWPSHAAARAHARAISAEMHSGFAALRRELSFDLHRRGPALTPGEDAARDIARVQRMWREARTRYGRGGEFLFGEFSIADAMYAPVALRFLTYGIALDPGCAAYVRTIDAMPAVRAWRAAAEAE
ncbi:MAG: glutathione S-transferase family protein [Mizugakiibacter sp.]|uniref:glutathione S-transferase family protein n=1 Tax=Mizugakiibacter sp. TaxID=1972610 RepID=UPI0031C8AF69|nr:glutathione S-transferase family protein [Xanthomonadaceae bacterium]